MEVKFKILGIFALQYQRRLGTLGPPPDTKNVSCASRVGHIAHRECVI